MFKIGVAIVTYNRLEKLKKTLECYELQTFLPCFITVFNNNSNDGTKEYLEEWGKKTSTFEKKIINNNENIGGSGGFYEAMKSSMEYDFDYLWISDDDAYPDRNAFKIIFDFLNTNKNIKLGAICGTVIESDGINCDHRSIYCKNKNKYPFGKISTKADYEKDYFYINIFSYVGTAILKEALIECGLTKKDYFIWCDDAEHSMRVSKKYDIICKPDIKIYHDVDKSNKQGISWKSYYGIRNRLDAIRNNGTKLQLLSYRLKYMFISFYSFFFDRKRYKLIKTAIYDYKHNIFGVSKIYKPGAKL